MTTDDKLIEDIEIEDLWNEFSNIFTDEDNILIEEDFHIWKKGTEIIDIWKWFNKYHSKGIQYLFNEYEE